MKNLVYLSVAVMCLAVTLMVGIHIGQTEARADFDPTGYVVGMYGGGNSVYVLTASDEVWHWTPVSEWVRCSEYDPPVSSSEIKLWSASAIVSDIEDLWISDGGGWTNVGSPTGPIAVEPTTWGQLKQKYGGDK